MVTIESRSGEVAGCSTAPKFDPLLRIDMSLESRLCARLTTRGQTGYLLTGGHDVFFKNPCHGPFEP